MKVSYVNKDGETKSRQDFVSVEMTVDELVARFAETMPSYMRHLDKASVQDAEHRKFSDNVPVHCIDSIMDFSENGSFDPRDEWVSTWLPFLFCKLVTIAHLVSHSSLECECNNCTSAQALRAICARCRACSTCRCLSTSSRDTHMHPSHRSHVHLSTGRHWHGGEQYSLLPLVDSVHLDTIKNLSDDDRARLGEHLESIDASLTIKECHVFLSADKKHDWAAVRHIIGVMNDWYDTNYHAAPPTYRRDATGGIARDADGCLIVDSCDCAGNPACGAGKACTCTGDGSCTRMHVTSTDGAGCQFRCREVHRYVSECASEGRRRRVWVWKCAAHGKDACDPAGGKCKRCIAEANRSCTDSQLFAINSVEQAVAYLQQKERERGDVVDAYIKKRSSQAILRWTYHIVPSDAVVHPTTKSDIVIGKGCVVPALLYESL
jgi:hypothetical protein